jgi:hypothetical protein
MPNFNTKGYSSFLNPFTDILPQNGRVRFKKGMPELEPVNLVQLQSGQDLPQTDEIIGLKKLRTRPERPTGQGTCVVIIDTGVFQHPLLKSKIIARHSANGDPTDIDDLHGHGTHMAGIIAGPETSCMGVANDTKIISIKVTQGSSGSGSWSAVYRAFQMILEHVNGTKLLATEQYQITAVNQ